MFQIPASAEAAASLCPEGWLTQSWSRRGWAASEQLPGLLTRKLTAYLKIAVSNCIFLYKNKEI